MRYAGPGVELIPAVKLYARLKRIHDNDSRFRDVQSTPLLRSLERTLRPTRSSPGTTEALIDELTEVTAESFWHGRPFDPTDTCRRLLSRGFDAVPTLIDHLADERLTRISEPRGFNNGSWTHIMRVGEVCRSVLHGLSADALWFQSGDDEPEQFRQYVTCWFEVAKQVGEERWATDHVLPSPAGGSPNTYLLRLIGPKYPHHLPRLYRTLLNERPRSDSRTMAAEVR